MIIDCHCHIFTGKVIRNVVSKAELIRELHLDAGAAARFGVEDLVASTCQNDTNCILFPTSLPENVKDENNRHIGVARSFPGLKTLATLHPDMDGLSAEAERVFGLGITGFKFCSFSQRFDILSARTERMLLAVRDIARSKGKQLTIVLDTFTRADFHFVARPEHLTTPAKLERLVRRHPDITFMAAHMGGLAADFSELRGCLSPAPNLYLDTSNAAHTLAPDQFVELLRLHGPEHILFGTDWPFFDHASEIPLVDSLLDKAGFSNAEKESVFRRNAEKIFFS
ncbi:MAG: amidohydrolase family protein [Smithella sp.]